jgi:hypothetical protein
VIARLPLYIAFAEEVCAVTERMAGQATAWLKTTGYKQTFRDRVVTGLCLKIDSSFRALIDDARAGRAETMHHLKTMVESFIYFHTVAADTSPERAKQLLAKVLHEKVKFLRDNMQPGAQTRIAELERERDALLAGAPPLPSVEQLAKSYGPSLGSWYSAVYRLACEPAHLGDLHEFMPGADDLIEIGPPITADYRASIGIDRACELAINMIDAVLQTTTAALSADVDTLRGKLAALRDPRSGIEETTP